MSSIVSEVLQEIESEIDRHPYITNVIKVAVVLWYIGAAWGVIAVFNTFSNEITECKACYADIGVEMRRRQNVIPKFANYYGKYISHEKDIMTHIADARKNIANSKDIPLGKQIENAKQMEGILSNMLLIVELYPDLRASQSAQNLMNELKETENRIAELKWKYNELAGRCAELYLHYPVSFIGWFFGYRTPVPFLATDDDLLKVPLVEFSQFSN